MFMEMKIQKFDYLDRMRSSELYRKKNPRIVNPYHNPVNRCQYRKDLEGLLSYQYGVVDAYKARFPGGPGAKPVNQSANGLGRADEPDLLDRQQLVKDIIDGKKWTMQDVERAVGSSSQERAPHTAGDLYK